jgi:hypothetical protein
MPKYSLKSGKDTHDIEHEPEESFEDFQAKVYALTDIPPKNMKVVFKGKMIKVPRSLCRTTGHCCSWPRGRSWPSWAPRQARSSR